eukprot:6767361-Prymnesium_polylepis.1
MRFRDGGRRPCACHKVCSRERARWESGNGPVAAALVHVAVGAVIARVDVGGVREVEEVGFGPAWMAQLAGPKCAYDRVER